MEYYSAIKRNKIGLFVEMGMDLETVTQSEVSQTNIIWYCLYVTSKENGTNESIYKTERVTDRENKRWLPKGKAREG